MSQGNYDWPGSRWWRVDIHAHSPASPDFRRGDDGRADWTGWLSAAAEAGLDAVAVTDHNTAAAVRHIQAAASEMASPPTVFPGVEITASDGVHLLILTDPGRRQEHVDDLLSRAGVSVDDRGEKHARSTLGVEQILKELGEEAVIVGAHVNGPRGILTEHGGHQRLGVLRDARLAAVEVDPGRDVDESWLDGSKSEVGRIVSQVWSSDAHNLECLGRRFTWMKMTRPNMEGLRLALLDGASSLTTASGEQREDLNALHGQHVIESITVAAARFMGRKEPLTIRFNPWLNAIIGGRGTGKSTLVDLCRKTLRLDSELDGTRAGDEGSLRNVFNRRVRVPPARGSDGLLTDDTRINVVYRKHGERFRLSWSLSGNESAIVRLAGDSLEPEEGSVSERFPASIFSQKQLFAAAQDTNALLTNIDRSSLVQAVQRKRELSSLQSKYLSLRAQARAAAARAERISACRAELGDVRHKLDFLQEGDQARQLSDYRSRQQHEETWQAVVSTAQREVRAVAEGVEQLAVADLDMEADPDPDASLEGLAKAHREFGRAVTGLRRRMLKAIEEAQLHIDRILDGDHLRRWRQALNDSAKAFHRASAQLADRGISSPDQYQELVAKASRLAREIDLLEREQAHAAELERQAARTLKRYRETRAALARARGEFASAIEGDVIRVEVVPFDDTGGLRDYLKGVLGTDRFEVDRGRLAKAVRPPPLQPWIWEGLDAQVADIRRLHTNESMSWPSRDRRFEAALKRIPPENIDRLALYCPSDTVRVQFQDRHGDWRPLAQGSPGQQTAALLAFVLGHGTEPIILDQPEDDLDNTLIYDLLVSQLKETKIRRQVIVVTHNPNIVVHGDAEFVLSMEAGEGESRKACEGGLQEQKVRDEICKVMEGGRQAFESRYRRIMPTEKAAT